MRAPRLLLVTTVPGTLRHFLLPYAEHMRERGWEVDALTGEEEGGVPEEVTKAFDQVQTMPWRRDVKAVTNWTTAPRRVRQLLVRERYDVLHTHTPVASLVSRLAVASLPKRSRPAVCYTAHGFHFHPLGRPSANRLFRGAERVAGHWTDRLLVLNEHDLAVARDRRFVPDGHAVLMPGVGIDLDHYRPTAELLREAEQVRADLGVAPGRALFTVLAELRAGKGHLSVVRALAADPGLDAVLACAGRGPQRDAVLQEAARLGVEDRVRLLGSVADVRPLVLASTATVLMSRREGLSRAVLESLALGVPVLGSRIRGIADVVDRPDAGVLVEPDDVEGLTAAMRAAVSYPGPEQLRVRLEPLLRRYELGSVLDRHAALYEELAARRTPVAPGG
ncbi:MAG TPA: glycosyltransferase [Mycobacteriales bacterium]|nr:glycosyltransferase [Mycobacteriales bacterium]